MTPPGSSERCVLLGWLMAVSERSCQAAASNGQCSPHEVADVFADLVAMGLQCEVAGVKEVDFAVGKVAAERLRASGAEDFVVLTQVTSRGG
jgi:hypothetical protein